MRIKKVVAIVLVIISSICFFACGFNGDSAYDIAVKNGFIGTEVEWLASLKGTNGKDGTDGTVATSLYTEALENGYEGSFEQFLLDYVKGEKGDTGSTGQDVISTAVNRSITSAVSVFATFTGTKTTSSFPFGGVTTTDYEYTSGGAGVIYKLNKREGDAYIITNYHVVYSSDSKDENKVSQNISIYLYGREFAEYGISATFIGGSMNYDIAILKVTNSSVLKKSTASSICISDQNIHVGDTAIAIGNPEGEGLSATSGIISVDSEEISMTAVDEQSTVSFRVLRIDTAVNSGNSGGGLFNSTGELIGIVNAKVISSDVENIGYAIPYTVAINVADNLIRNYDGNLPSKVKKGLIGITTVIEDSNATFNSLTKKVDIVQIIKITDVLDNSLGKTAGLMVDDIIESVVYDNVTYIVNRNYVLPDLLLKVEIGKTLSFNIIREEVKSTINFSFQTLNVID